jgi:RND family efflux transporter MFP subunit
VTAWRELDLTAEVSGRVLWQSPAFRPGVVVAAGVPLLRIDPTDYQLALAEAEQALASAKLTLADAQVLKQSARVEESKAAVAAAEARKLRAQRDLANTEIVAPYAAVIDEQQAVLGQFITTGSVLGRILGTERAEVRLPILPQDIAFLEQTVGARVVLSAPAAPGGGLSPQWEGRLARVEARVDPETRVIPVVVEVAAPLDTEQHAQPLPFGLFARVTLPGRALQDAVALPQTAVRGDDEVFLVEDGRLLIRKVVVARHQDGQALVTQGLSDGDHIVLTRLELMLEGMAVAVADD